MNVTGQRSVSSVAATEFFRNNTIRCPQVGFALACSSGPRGG